MSEVKVNKISPRTNCGTVQLGDSGDTITIPAGATITNNGTQTGFGRTGTVNWDTTAKTASFTAVSGNGYFVNTTSGAITVTLPASPSGGDIVAVKDYAQTFATNNCTIARNSSNIEGIANDVTLDGDAESVTFVYVDSTKGWVLVNEATTKYGPGFVTATGGTVTTCGNFKVHTFTGPGTFTVTCAGNPAGSNTVDYLVVAGGGSAGFGDPASGGGGGGAGGFRVSNSVGCIPAPTMSPLANPTGLPVTVQGYPITVGAGGAESGTNGNDGNNSVFSTITSALGGGGGYSSGTAGHPGGSGGGSRSSGGSGNTPPVSPPQGNDGAGGAPNGPAGGGGGAGGAALAGTPGGAGDGGIGSFVSPSFAVSCAGTTGPVPGVRYFAGGGGGGPPVGAGADGGEGGGAPSSSSGDINAGTANTGGGGGGNWNGNGGAGGSGIVIIRYKYQ